MKSFKNSSMRVLLLMTMANTLSCLFSPPDLMAKPHEAYLAYTLPPQDGVSFICYNSLDKTAIFVIDLRVNVNAAMSAHQIERIAESYRCRLQRHANQQASSYKQFEANLESPSKATANASVRLIRPGRSCTTQS